MPIVSLKDFLNRPFDYLIVGGGTAGLCLAARYAQSYSDICIMLSGGRLSEDRDTIVGVLEAGEYSPNVPVIDVPGSLLA